MKALATVAKALVEGTMKDSSVARLQHSSKVKTKQIIKLLDDPKMREPLSMRVERISKGSRQARRLPVPHLFKSTDEPHEHQNGVASHMNPVPDKKARRAVLPAELREEEANELQQFFFGSVEMPEKET